MLSRDMEISTIKRIQATVLAHHIEHGTPITYREVADRILGGNVTTRDIREAALFTTSSGLTVTSVTRESGTAYKTIEALEPETSLKSRVIAHIKTVHSSPAVKAAPVVMVG